jgi:hypothetical protein
VARKSKDFFSPLEHGLAWFGLAFSYAFSSYFIWMKWLA